MEEMADISTSCLKAVRVNWSHHGSTYNFAHLRRLFGIEVHRYRNVHALRLYVDSSGLWVKWKQYVSDETWCQPRLVAEFDRLDVFAAAKPPLVAHEFGELENGKHLNFLNKLEPWPDFSSLTLKRL